MSSQRITETSAWPSLGTELPTETTTKVLETSMTLVGFAEKLAKSLEFSE